MKKLNITKEAFEKSKHFQRKYGKLEYVSESGKLFKTNKGHVIKFVKESEDVEQNSLKMKLVRKAKQATEQAMDILDQAAEEVKNAAGETFLYARLDYHARDLDKTIDELSAILNKDSAEEASVNESNDDSGWFNEIGELTPPDWAIDEFGIDPDKSPLPDECVRACSHSGRVDDDVSVWVDELKFDQNFPVERARRWLKEYGAWDEEELAEMDARELAEKALWIFACDISDGETYCTMDA